MQISAIPRPASRDALRLTDVETWLQERHASETKRDAPANGQGVTSASYSDSFLSTRQARMLCSLADEGGQALPAFVESACSWEPVEQARAALRKSQRKVGVTTVHLAAWCVVCAMADHPRFRSAFAHPNRVREFTSVNFGIAVALPDDDLAVAVVREAERMDFLTFCTALNDATRNSRQGIEEAGAAQVVLSTLWNFPIYNAIPIVVPPAAATLFIGTPQLTPQADGQDGFHFVQTARLALTFDHRFINGVGASAFLLSVKTRLEALPTEFGDTTPQSE